VHSVVALIALVAFVVVVVDAWRSPASTGAKVGWTIAAFLFSIITLVVWYAWGRKRAY
jgi:hypothetical protein